MGNAAGGFLPGHMGSDLLLQLWIPARSPGNPGRKTGAFLYKGAAQPFHMEYSGDMMRTLLHYRFLNVPLPVRRLVKGGDPPHLQGTYRTDAERHLCGELLHILIIFPKREHSRCLSHLFIQAHLL